MQPAPCRFLVRESGPEVRLGHEALPAEHQAGARPRRPRLRQCRAYVSAVLPGGLGGQRLEPLAVELGGTAVVLGVGVTGVAAVLMEKARLRRKGRGLMTGLRSV